MEYGNPSFGHTRRLPGWTFGDAVQATRDALATQGFGVLTEIDVEATLKKKLDVDMPHYVILGACNPPFAHQALSAMPGIGLLLPCNVVVAEEEGAIAVSTIDAREMFKVVDLPEVAPIAEQVNERLEKALAAIGA